MKTANLESLTISPPEESKAFLDGEEIASPDFGQPASYAEILDELGHTQVNDRYGSAYNAHPSGIVHH